MEAEAQVEGTFRQHLAKFIFLSPDEFSEVTGYFSHCSADKKENLMVAGQVCRWHYFVGKGCLRQFFIDEKGVEKTTAFAIENWWMTDNRAYEQQATTPFYIQAVEPSRLLRIEGSAQEQLLRNVPQMERYFRFVYQRAYAAAQMRIKLLYGLTREELYHHFQEHFPEFIQRIPQYLLASFLGFTPEYLSEIRSRHRS